VVDVVFGTVDPSGRLPETIPIAMDDILATSYFPGSRNVVQYREGLDVGYRYFDSNDIPVRFPFGHGLTYTSERNVSQFR
jgi:beta-glucosidase